MYDGSYQAWQQQQGNDAEWFGELLAVPLDPRYPEPVTVVQFDQQYEALWAGTESGMLYTLQCPMPSRYASWQCHPSAVLDLQLLSDCAISVSSSRVALTTNGGYTRAAANLTEEGELWVSAVVEPGTGSSRLLVAGSSGHIYTHDLIANKVNKQAAAVAGDGLVLLRGPVGHRGAVAAGTGGGRVLLVDSRTIGQPSSSTLAHVGGISAMEVQGDMIATAGFSRRMGQVMADNLVKVFDCRSVLRPLFSVPCSSPSMLAWHPINSMSLMCASSNGLFMFADPSNPATVETYQVDTAGDSLRCASLSPSGEAVAFGGSGGYLHLWAASHQPRITARSRNLQRLTHPTRKAPNRTRPVISEQGPFSAAQSPQALLLAAAMAAGATSTAAAAAAVAGARLLSDVPESLSIDVGKPPRVIDPAIQKDLNQVDNIGYVPNPHYSRAKAAGTARKAALHLQHKRLQLADDHSGAEAARAARVQSRLAEGGTLLPQRYKRLVIRAQSSMRFEEFDFTYYNKTKFAGLENDLPNCYCNALLQVFYFTPAFRAAILQHKPEPALEFCLTCELLFLFKMLLSAAGGLPCQALNLLRALRQNREAAALGLLEGTIGAGAGGLGALSPTPGGSGGLGSGLGGVGVGAAVMGGAGQGSGGGGGLGEGGGGLGGAEKGVPEWGGHAALLAANSALPKRVVTLCRFLLDHLYKEAGGEAAATAHNGDADSSSAQNSSTQSTAAAAAAADGSSPAVDSQAPAAAVAECGSTSDSSSSAAEQADKQQQQQPQQQPDQVGKQPPDKQRPGSNKGRKGKKGKDSTATDDVSAAAGTGSNSNNATPQDGSSSSSSSSAEGAQLQNNLANVIQDLFGLVYRSDMTALSGPKKGTSKSRQLKTFQVDLAYPEASSSSGSGSGRAAAGSGGSAAAAASSPSIGCSPVKAGSGGMMRAESPAPGSVGSCPASPSWLPPLSPSPSHRPATPLAGGTAAAAATAGMPGLCLGPAAAEKPGFGVLLANSLRSESVTKAWFDESGGYAYVRQSRVPLVLPKTLVINCAMTHPAQAALWDPTKPAAAAAATAAAMTPQKQQQQHQEQQAGVSGSSLVGSTPTGKGGGVIPSPCSSSSSSSSVNGTAAANGAVNGAAAGQQYQNHHQQHEAPWLPWVMQVRSHPASSQVDVITAETLDELAENARELPAAPIQATYELTAMVCHITDEDEAEQQLSSAAAAAAATPGMRGLLVQSPSPGSKATGTSSNLQQQGHAVALIRVQPPYLEPDLIGGLIRFPSAVPTLMSVGSGAAAAVAAVAGSGSSLTRRLSSQGSGAGAGAAAAAAGSRSSSVSGPKGGSGGGSTAAAGFSLPDSLDDVFAELSISPPCIAEYEGDQGGEEEEQQQQQEEADDDAAGAALTSADEDGEENDADKQELQEEEQQQQQEEGVGGSSSSGGGGGAGQQWVVINDFSINPVPPAEVMNWYNAQKLPCLLFYTQLSELEAAKALPPPEPPQPVDAHTFAALCAAPPLQGPNWHGRRLFAPLEFPLEAPRPGFMVAIDAEFVAVARAETSFEGGVEVQLKPSRLALARVSVLRGSGPAAGGAFIDDYVACVEPVVDYLTRWSGIRPGDLDPSTSPHHLVSLKTAYLKLHHLLDAGCVFIGHGLKQDFRMLNLTVPPEQVRDTVELFSFRRQRKLSLRFLASYLLGLTIQTGAGAAGAAAAAVAAAATTSAAAAGGTGKAGAAADGKGGATVVVAAAAAKAGPVPPPAIPTVLPGGVLMGSTGQGHDSIEDAATALALYNVYCKLQAEGRLEEKLHEMYRWGKQYGWDPVVYVNGVPQPAASAGVVSVAPVM